MAHSPWYIMQDSRVMYCGITDDGTDMAKEQ